MKLPEPVHQRVTLIDGELKPWTGATKKVLSAICTRGDNGLLKQIEIGSLPEGTVEDADEALAAAVKAYNSGGGEWPTMPVAERLACMQKFVNAMVARRLEVVRLIMWEIGKSWSDSEKEFDRTVDYIKATMDSLKDLDNGNSRFLIVEGTIAQIRRTPLGVVLCLGPYNYPINETLATLIPALIMGNSVILKPPSFGALSFLPLLEAFRSSFPKGAINTVYGPGAEVVPRLLESGQVNVLTLIGSSRVASHLKKLAPKANRLRAILGLDAKNAAIVLPDADIDLAVTECLSGALTFNGQRCTALKMLLLHRSIADTFLDKFMVKLNQLKIGMPWEKGVAITPLPDLAKVEYLKECVADARAKGAKVLNPGGGETDGTMFRPALVYPVSDGMKLYREEQFGPIVAAAAFDDISTALEYIVTSDHGQQVSIFSSNPEIVGKLVDPLVNQVCRVNINSQCQRGPDVFPFTGRKDSAEGTLSVSDALRSFSIRSMIAAKQTETNKKLLNDIVTSHNSKFISTNFVF
jgi:aldehyde dehydrogenase (NAD+)